MDDFSNDGQLFNSVNPSLMTKLDGNTFRMQISRELEGLSFLDPFWISASRYKKLSNTLSNFLDKI